MPEINRQEMHREVITDQRFPRWWDKWINPTTILAVLGGIIWGIQLNIAVVTHTSDIAKLEENAYRIEQMDQDHAHQITKIGIVLENLVVRLEELHKRTGTHIQEGEAWKRVIGLNEQRIKQLEKESKK